MGFSATVRHNLRHYADFRGRAQRAQFWWWYLFLIVMQVVLNAVDGALGLQVGETDLKVGDTAIPVVSDGVGVLSTVFGLAVVLPTLAVAVRRLHDTDRSGWWIVAPLAAYVLTGVLVAVLAAFDAPGFAFAIVGVGFVAGAILALVVLVFFIQKGTAGTNTHGPDPLGQGA